MGIIVTIDGVRIPCDVAGDDPAILSGLKVVWGRDDRVSIPGAPSCEFDLVDPLGGLGHPEVVTFDSVVEVRAESPDGSTVRVFLGNVSDLTLTHDGVDAVVHVTAMHPVARLSAVSMGDEPWPAQSPSERAVAINNAVPAGTMYVDSPNIPGVQLVSLDVDNRTAEDVVHEFYTGLGVIPYPTASASGVPTWRTFKGVAADKEYGVLDTERANRRVPYAPLVTDPESPIDGVPRPTVIIDACDVDLDGTEFRANVTDTGMNVRVTYGPQDDQRTTFMRGNINVENPRTFEVTSGVGIYNDTNPDSWAIDVAGYWYSQFPEWRYDFDAPWAVGTLQLDPDTVTAMDDFHLAMMALLSDELGRPTEGPSRHHQLVMLQNLPPWTPWRRGTREGDPHTPHEHCPHVVGILLGGTYTYDAGRWVLEFQLSVERALQSELAPLPVVVVHPGDVVPYDHDTDTVDFQPEPATMWPVGATATFTDGKYGWDGTAWVAGGTDAILVMPGSVHDDLAHDDARVRAQPSTSWPPGQYATFTDGTFRWDGDAWGPMVMVAPGETVTVDHTDPSVAPDPDTAWAADDYATFTDGTYRWDGEAWAFYVVPIVVHPGDVVDVAHDAPGVTPEPATAWPNDAYAIFTDGAWRWDGEAWVVVWTVVATNLASNPHAASADGWSFAAGFGGEVDLTTETASDTPDGHPGYRRATVVTPDTGGYSGHRFNEPEVGEAGEVLTFSVYVRASAPVTFTLNASTRVGSWAGDTGASPATAAPAGQWVRLWATITTTQAYDALLVVLNENAAGPAAGATIDATQVLLERHDTLRDYFDGDTPDTDTERHAWLGVPGASRSTLSAQRTEPDDVVVTPGATVDVAHDDPLVRPEPSTAWAPDEHATFTDGTFRWDGDAWVAWIPSWAAVPEGVAWDDVPAGTAWNEWTGEI